MGIEAEEDNSVFKSWMEVVGGREGSVREMGGLRVESRWIV